MDQPIDMAVVHGLGDLFYEDFGSFLIKSSFFLDVGEELPSLEVFHDYGNLHIFESQAIMNFYDVIVLEGF